MDLGHFENRSMKKNTKSSKSMETQTIYMGFPIVKYPDFYEFRRFSSFLIDRFSK